MNSYIAASVNSMTLPPFVAGCLRGGHPGPTGAFTSKAPGVQRSELRSNSGTCSL
jgi:hypothetical protein